MNTIQEVILLKSIIFHKDIELIEILDEKIFSIPILKLCFYVLKQYILNYNHFPNKTEFLTFLQSLIEKNIIELPQDELQRQTELKKIESLIDYASKSLNEVQDEILNPKQTKEEIQKLIIKNVFRYKIEDLKEVIKTGEQAEELLSSLRKSIEKYSIIIDEAKDVEWFLAQEIPVRKDVKETGYLFIDKHLEGGLGAGEIALIASPPGRGKTTFLTNLAFNYLTLHEDLTLLYISLELSEAQIFARIMSIYFQIPLQSFKNKSPKEIIKENLESKLITIEEFKKFFKNFYIKYFAPGTDIMQITKYIKQFKKVKKPPSFLVLIDYLNEIDYPYIKEIWHKFDKISTELDNLVTENDIILWVACQAHPKAKKPLKDSSSESNQLKSKIIFDLKDLYGSKIGLSKKLTAGLGITQVQNSDFLYLSFFKNRITGKINEIAQLKFNKQTYRLELLETTSGTYTDDFDFSQDFSPKIEVSKSDKISNIKVKENLEFDIE